MTDSLQTNVHNNKEDAVTYLQRRINIESSPDFRHRLLAVLRTQSPPQTITIDLAPSRLVCAAFSECLLTLEKDRPHSLLLTVASEQCNRLSIRKPLKGTKVSI